jgi:hypothetical protein
MNRIIPTLIGLAMLAPTAARADMLATMVTGGLQLLSTDQIAMVSEDLTIDMGEVRVRDEFRNLGDNDVEATVAFRLPPIDMREAYQASLAGIESDDHDFLGFSLWVDGKVTEAELLVRAIAGGRDVKALLDRHGIPYSTYHPAFRDRWSALPAEVVADLVQEGAAAIDGATGAVEPLWQFEAIYHWQQDFPVGATVTVEHAYTPLVSGSFVRFGAGDDLAFVGDGFCLDAATEAVVIERLEEMPKDADGSGVVWLWRADHLLTAARSWAGPIGRFTLTVEAGSAGNVAALCEDGIARFPPSDVQETEAATYVIERENFEPAGAMHIVVMAFPGTPEVRFPADGLPP